MSTPSATDPLLSQQSGSPQPSSSCLPTPKIKLNRAPENQPPPVRDLPEVDIFVKHPGYEEGENDLMFFRGFDRSEEREGLHHGTVLTACHIVSGRNDGFLAEEKGGTPIDLSFDNVLTRGNYYYTVPNDDCYAVFPSFQYWPFPYGRLPPSWTKLRKPRATRLTLMPAQSFTVQAILDRDMTCLLSGLGDIRERAYICPKEESPWFQANAMGRYNLNRLLTVDARIDDMSNATVMRSDIYKAYDKRLFVMVPKNDCWTVHFMEPTYHLGSLYHNMPVNLHTDVGLEYMFSRFAWTIFPLIRDFLEQGPPRQVRTRSRNGKVNKVTDKNLDKEAISRTFFPRGRSASPKKRKAGDDDDPTVADSSAEMEQRGRKRRRSYSSSEDAEAEDWKHCLGLSPKGHSRAMNDQSQSTGIAGSLSTTPQRSASLSCPEPASPVSVALDRLQTTRDSYGETGIMDKDPRIQQLYDDEDKYERLRRKELERRRPRHNPDLYCCNYDKHQESFFTAIKGEGPWDAHELCDECLGGEYLPLAADLDV
ncbi:MAG: hypothetical protein L6R42_000030 [Xanthoria sp. 1 TBL-2021]|nr:MAG: hypothetical protein L6R42_000030 [Xanthoria sp. 1 TBL-2021]